MADTSATDVNSPADDFADLGAEILGEPTSTEESSTEDNKETTPAADAPKEEPAKPTETEGEETKDESDAANPDETKEGEKPKRDAEARKQQLNDEIRKLVAEKKQRQAEVERLNSQVYRTETAEELVANGMDPDEARAESERQSWEMEKFNRDITDLNQTIDLQVAQVMTDFSWADPESPDYDKASAERAYKAFQKYGQPVIDEKTGFVTNLNVMPYDVYADFNAERLAARQSGAIQGQKATEKMLAAAEPPSSAPARQSEEDEDDFLRGFNKR